MRSKKNVQKILSKEMESHITFINKTFIDSHGHIYGIGNLDYIDDHDLWKCIHANLSKSIDLDELDNIMEKHKYILTSKYNFNYDLIKISEEYVFNVWCDFCFGKNINVTNDYIEIRNQIIFLLQKTFYSNKLYLVPIIGNIFCKFKYWLYKKEFNCIDIKIKSLLEKTSNGFLHKFYSNISNEQNAKKILIDNAFLSFLVFNFLNSYTQHFMANFSNYQIYGNVHKYQENILSRSFLFPCRLRKISKKVDIFDKGDYVLLDLVTSNNLFSYGPRTCIGNGFTNKYTNFLIKLLTPYNIATDSSIIISNDNNIPLIKGPINIRLELPKDYLKHNLTNYDHKNLKFYKIESICENIEIFKYSITKMCEIINQYQNIDGILTSESRGFIFASPISDRLNLPLFCARKKGKLPGNVLYIKYKKAYDSEEQIELTEDTNLISKNIVLVDDGIASGATTIALHQLANICGANVLATITVVRHNYVKNQYDLSPIHCIFDL